METQLKIVAALCFARIHTHTLCTDYLFAMRPKKILWIFSDVFFFRSSLTLHILYFTILLTLGIEPFARKSFRTARRAIIETILNDDEIDVRTENEATTISY